MITKTLRVLNVDDIRELERLIGEGWKIETKLHPHEDRASYYILSRNPTTVECDPAETERTTFHD